MKALIDTYFRKHDYLRVSLIERCNLRCTYCMPEEGIALRSKACFMNEDELLTIIETFVSLGVKKIRLTGGEPLIKKNFAAIVERIAELPVKINLTTNGVLLNKYFDLLKTTGVENLNISLDTLDTLKFNKITRRNDFERVIKNIKTAIKKEFNVKLNVVLMKGVNDNEILDFISLTKDNKISVRFIEFMPFQGNNWDITKKISEAEILETAHDGFEEIITRMPAEPNKTANNYKVEGFKGSFGIISTVTNPFCDTCNRIRLTADGKIKNCLFSQSETDLLSALRNNIPITSLIQDNIAQKAMKLGGLNALKDSLTANRPMTTIGG